jgi:hypothetical protein
MGHPGIEGICHWGRKAQIAPETVLIMGIMMFFLLSMFLVNIHIEDSWNGLRGSLEASSAASRMAQQINQVAQGGDGASYTTFNSAPLSVSNMTIFAGRALRANYEYGGYVSIPLATDSVIILDQLLLPDPGQSYSEANNISLNKDLLLNNVNGTVYIRTVD